MHSKWEICIVHKVFFHNPYPCEITTMHENDKDIITIFLNRFFNDYLLKDIKKEKLYLPVPDTDDFLNLKSPLSVALLESGCM